MSSTNRRSVVAAMGACFALAGFSLPVRLSAAARRITIAQESFTLRRELVRELGGGASIMVTRDWRGRIEPTQSGARVEAEQIACVVKAPALLAGLAKIERERVITGLFPIDLAIDGQIASWGSSSPTGVRAAVEAAADRLEAAAVDPALQRDAKAYLAAIGKTAAELVSQVPRDLFFPEPGTRTERKDLELPGGVAGSYEVTISAKACRHSGLLEESERRIVTRIGETSRIASERWSMLGGTT